MSTEPRAARTWRSSCGCASASWTNSWRQSGIMSGRWSSSLWVLTTVKAAQSAFIGCRNSPSLINAKVKWVSFFSMHAACIAFPSRIERYLHFAVGLHPSDGDLIPAACKCEIEGAGTKRHCTVGVPFNPPLRLLMGCLSLTWGYLTSPTLNGFVWWFYVPQMEKKC